jgi:hypothetical protein
VFLVNSRLGIFSCDPSPLLKQSLNSHFRVRKFILLYWPLSYYVKSGEGRTLSLTYGRFFAEFLGDLSLVRLSLLDQNTCVGLRYGLYVVMLRNFSWKRAPMNLHRPRPPDFCSARIIFYGFTYRTSSRPKPKFNNRLIVQPSVIPSHYTQVTEY